MQKNTKFQIFVIIIVAAVVTGVGAYYIIRQSSDRTQRDICRAQWEVVSRMREESRSCQTDNDCVILNKDLGPVYSRAMDPLCPSPCYEYITINKNTNLTDLSRQVSDSSAKCSEAPSVPCPNVTCPATLTNPKAICLKNICRVVESASATTTDTSTGSTSLTTGWQTYRNEQYGFEVKYPSGWQIDENNLSNASPSLTIGNSLNGLYDYTVNIYIFQNPQNLPAKEYVQKMLQESKKQNVQDGGGIQFDKEFALQIGDIEAYELYGVFGYDAAYEQVYATNQDRVYLISFDTAETLYVDSQKNNELAHQILLTFKFIQ